MKLEDQKDKFSVRARTMSDKLPVIYTSKRPSYLLDKENAHNINLMIPLANQMSTNSASIHIKHKQIQQPKSESSDIKQIRLSIEALEKKCGEIQKRIEEGSKKIDFANNMMCEAIQRGDYNAANLYKSSLESYSAENQMLGAKELKLMNQLDKLEDKLRQLVKQQNW